MLTAARPRGWISDAEVAEIGYTAFTSKKTHTVTARLIVRRVRRLAPPTQGELLPAWRHHAIFTDSPFSMLAAENRPPRPRQVITDAHPEEILVATADRNLSDRVRAAGAAVYPAERLRNLIDPA